MPLASKGLFIRVTLQVGLFVDYLRHFAADRLNGMPLYGHYGIILLQMKTIEITPARSCREPNRDPRIILIAEDHYPDQCFIREVFRQLDRRR
jgi:hypothetical protein